MRNAEAILRGLARGEQPLEAVEALGIVRTTSSGGRALSPPDIEPAELPLADLAAGLLVHWAAGTTLQEWAALILMLDLIQFVETESPDEDVLLAALWSASAGEPVSEEALGLARRLAR